MDRVLTLPVAIGRHGQHRQDTPQPVVGAGGPEQAAMPAVVLKDEGPHQKESGGYRQQQGQPIPHLEAETHQGDDRGQRPERRPDLPDTPVQDRLLVSR